MAAADASAAREFLEWRALNATSELFFFFLFIVLAFISYIVVKEIEDRSRFEKVRATARIREEILV